MFIARQPIFTKSLHIYGYELLFRAEEDSHEFSDASSSSATAVVLGGLFEQGIEKVVGSVKAFVNFDYNFIMSDMVELINPETLVIEVLECVKFDFPMQKRLEELSKKGYKIALDDFNDNIFTCPVLPMANIIKFDILNTPLDTIQTQVNEALAKKKILLAEKIETEADFLKAMEMGFHLFQGYFFCKPKIVLGSSNTKQTPKAIYTQVLCELNRDDFSYDKIAGIIETDVNLSYRFLRVMSNKSNKNTFDSIKSLLVKMGLLEIERWICVLMLQTTVDDKPDELIRQSLIRSKFSEYITERSFLRKKKDEASLMSLFSLLDVLLNSTMEQALDGLSISEDIKEALIYGRGVFKPLSTLVGAYENGNWTMVDECARELHLNTKTILRGYLMSIEWADSVIKRVTESEIEN